MQYRVTKIFGRGSEQILSDFKDKQTALNFIQEKLAEDKRFKLTASYRLYDLGDFVKEYTVADLVETPDASSQSQGASSSQTFNPTPFNTAPRPGGVPHSWVKDKETDKKEKDK